MINFNNVIENFNTVYENRNSHKNAYFLNASLEVIKDKSQKASFFDIVEALQFRKWETEGTPSETSKAIKKIWLQAKFIYDNEPFSIRAKSILISLFNQSITEGTFLDQKKLKVYSKQVQFYCELLYLCKIIASAEEKLTNLSEKIGMPANLQAYSDSLEEKYAKALAFHKTPTFELLKNLKYTDPLSYLSVFIEEKEGQINNTYPKLLELFELAEYAPIHSKARNKKEKSAKQNYSPELLRKKMLSLLKNAPNEKLTKKQKELFAYTYGFFKESKMSREDYQQFIKIKLQEYKDKFLPIEKDFEHIEKEINNYSKADKLISKSILFTGDFCELIIKEMFDQENPLPTYLVSPIAKIQNTYRKIIEKFIENFKRIYTPLLETDLTTKTISTTISEREYIFNFLRTKGEFFENRTKRFGPDYANSLIEIEENILREHFPTLFSCPNYLSSVKTRSQVKKELESIDSVYSSLIKELSKIALFQLPSQKEIHTVPNEYQSFFTLLGCDSKSLPSPEELISLNLKHPVENFFSDEDVQALDKLIINFEDLQKRIFQQKIEVYCKEYVTLKNASLKKPPVIEEESFVGPIASPESAASIPTEELPSIIKEKKIITINEPSSSTGTIPKKKQHKNLPASFKEESTVSENSRKFMGELPSLTCLPSVRREKKKIPAFQYHSRVKRWITNPNSALRDPAYRNLTQTPDGKKETLAFHAFPQLIDSLIGTNYCWESEENKEGKLIKTYKISGEIIIQDIIHSGSFTYTIDPELGVCFHRFFDPPIHYSAEEQSLPESRYFSHKNLDIKFHSQDQKIQIDDPTHQMKIYIYPRSLE